MSGDEIAAVVIAFGDLARVVQRADPPDKAEIRGYVRGGLEPRNTGISHMLGDFHRPNVAGQARKRQGLAFRAASRA